MTPRLLCALALVFLVSKVAVSAPTCPAIILDLAPCLSYLEDKDASPQCCKGVKGLTAIAKTKGDRTSICNCVKKALSTYKYDPKLITVLPDKCGVVLELPPVDQSYDCSKA